MNDLFDEDMPAFRARLSGKTKPRSERKSSRSARHRGGRGKHIAPPTTHSQRVVVQVQSRKVQGSAKASAYMRYLLREGVGPEGEQAKLFTAGKEPVDPSELLKRSKDDRHQFRIVISPESGDRLDLEEYTRNLVETFEDDLGTRLDWAAVAHHNTANPHVHLVIRGVDDAGEPLYIDSNYIAQGMRRRAQELATFELGPRTERDIQRAHARQIEASHWTELDRELLKQAVSVPTTEPSPPDVPDPLSVQLDLSPDVSGDERVRNETLYKRLRYLHEVGLAYCVDKASWSHWIIAPDLEDELRNLGERKDIVKRMYAAQRGESSTWQVGTNQHDIVGRIAYRGLHNEHSGEEYIIVDGVDGNAHYLKMSEFADDVRPNVGALVDVQPGPSKGKIHVVAKKSLRDQTSYAGPCWLDKTLLVGGPTCASGGFGAELRAAQKARLEQLQRLGLVEPGASIPQDLLKRTRALELRTLESRLSEHFGKPCSEVRPGASFEGRLRQHLDLPGGHYSVLESRTSIVVVPTDKFLARYEPAKEPRIRLTMRTGKDGRARLYSKNMSKKDKGRTR